MPLPLCFQVEREAARSTGSGSLFFSGIPPNSGVKGPRARGLPTACRELAMCSDRAGAGREHSGMGLPDASVAPAAAEAKQEQKKVDEVEVQGHRTNDGIRPRLPAWRGERHRLQALRVVGREP